MTELRSFELAGLSTVEEEEVRVVWLLVLEILLVGLDGAFTWDNGSEVRRDDGNEDGEDCGGGGEIKEVVEAVLFGDESGGLDVADVILVGSVGDVTPVLAFMLAFVLLLFVFA